MKHTKIASPKCKDKAQPPELLLPILAILCITGKLCNQAFCEMPGIFKHFAKSLIHLIPDFQAFREMPKYDSPVYFIFIRFFCLIIWFKKTNLFHQ